MKNVDPTLIPDLIKALRSADDALSDVLDAELGAGNGDHEDVQYLDSVLSDVADVLNRVDGKS